jgi:ACS family hexuronate transporter-like MFS transporter
LNSYSWKEVFWITGASGFIWLIFWLIFYQVPARQKRLTKEEFALIREDIEADPDKENISKVKIRWYRLFTFPQTWALITGKGLIDPIFWFFLFWLPSYFSSTYELDLKRPSLELIVIYSATTIGSLLKRDGLL